MKQGNLRWIWLSIIIIILDQFSKYYVSYNMYLGESIKVIPFLNLTLAHNRGSAFSFLDQAGGWQLWFFTGVAVLICVVIGYWLSKLPRQQHWTACALSLIFGGALGNVFDRMLHGYVIDFIDFYIGNWHWPIFNVADSAIVIGVLMLILEALRKKKST